jgi:hypothetical protein
MIPLIHWSSKTRKIQPARAHYIPDHIENSAGQEDRAPYKVYTGRTACIYNLNGRTLALR